MQKLIAPADYELKFIQGVFGEQDETRGAQGGRSLHSTKPGKPAVYMVLLPFRFCKPQKQASIETPRSLPNASCRARLSGQSASQPATMQALHSFTWITPGAEVNSRGKLRRPS